MAKLNEDQKYLKNENIKIQMDFEKMKNIQNKNKKGQDLIKKRKKILLI